MTPAQDRALRRLFRTEAHREYANFEVFKASASRPCAHPSIFVKVNGASIAIDADGWIAD